MIASCSAAASDQHLHSVAAAASSEADQQRELLTDRRLVRVSDKKLVYSHIVGKATTFLLDCCTDFDVCPRVQPFVDGSATPPHKRVRIGSSLY